MRDLLRAVAKTGGGSAASLLMGVVTMKIFAVTLGPPGVGLFSLLRQAQQTALVLALLNGQMAIIQLIASNDEGERRRVVSTMFWILAIPTALMVLSFLAGAPWIARWLTGETGAASAGMVRGLAISIVGGATWMFFMNVLNGYRLIGRAASIQATNFLVVALLAYPASRLVSGGTPMAYTWILNAGALVAALLALVLAWRSGVARIGMPHFDDATKKVARRFLALVATMIVSGFLGFWVPLEIRTIIVDVFGLEGAGIFDVAWTLSMAYVLIILTSFSSYYLPTLSQTTDPEARRELMGSVFRLASILVLPLVTAVVVAKPLVITLLYSSEFTPALEIIRWMLIGDYFKVLSWVFSFTMVAYADMRTFLWTEVVWGGMTLASAAFAVKVLKSMEMIGITFLLLYILYFLYCGWYAQRRHGFSWRRHVNAASLLGLLVIVAASAHTWNDTTIRWGVAIFWTLLACACSWMLLTGGERRSAFARVRSVFARAGSR